VDRDTVEDLGTGRGAACRSPRRDPDSPLSCFQRMLDRLRECAEVGVGDHEVIDVGLPRVLVHRASTTRGSVLYAHNLADRPVTVRVPDIGAHAGQLVDPFP
jgi:maltose alpha-D-glucosyltransferase / alpha-amylase